MKFKDFKFLYHLPVRKNLILPDDQFLDHQVKSSSPVRVAKMALTFPST